jgi:hypothetical protein
MFNPPQLIIVNQNKPSYRDQLDTLINTLVKVKTILHDLKKRIIELYLPRSLLKIPEENFFYLYSLQYKPFVQIIDKTEL